MDSSSLRLPKRIAETNKYTLSKILDRPPSGEGVIEDFYDDGDAPPGDPCREETRTDMRIKLPGDLRKPQTPQE